MMSVAASDIHRNDATGGAYVRSFAEAIQTLRRHQRLQDLRARRRPAYAGVAVPDLPTGYTKSVTAVQSWNGSVIWLGYVHRPTASSASTSGSRRPATTSTGRTRR